VPDDASSTVPGSPVPVSIVSVSRRIEAPAHVIFELLADPSRHPAIDGSGMLRPGADNVPVSAVGDVFVMNMHFDALGDYTVHNHVVDFEPDRLLAWAPAPGDAAPAAAAGVAVGTPPDHVWRFELAPEGPDATLVTESYDCSRASEVIRTTVHEGRSWLPSMTGTLERLDALARGTASGHATA
jgi:hypothetical protein